MPNKTTVTYNRTTGSVYHAQGNKPRKGRRDTSEVKVAACIAADYYRDGGMTFTEACVLAGVHTPQVIGVRGYFENTAEILRTPKGTIPNKRWGVDPGPVDLRAVQANQTRQKKNSPASVYFPAKVFTVKEAEETLQQLEEKAAALKEFIAAHKKLSSVFV